MGHLVNSFLPETPRYITVYCFHDNLRQHLQMKYGKILTDLQTWSQVFFYAYAEMCGSLCDI